MIVQAISRHEVLTLFPLPAQRVCLVLLPLSDPLWRMVENASQAAFTGLAVDDPSARKLELLFVGHLDVHVSSLKSRWLLAN